MIQIVHTIQELEKNTKYKLTSDYEEFIISIPQEFKELEPVQLWLLSHQITAFTQGMGLNHGFVIENENLEDYKFRGDRKVKHQKVNPEWQFNNLKSLVTWLSDYKTKWNGAKEYDCHPQNWDEFMKSENHGNWEERLWVLLMIVLLQDKKCKNVQYRKIEKLETVA